MKKFTIVYQIPPVGAILAMIISWDRNHSIPLALIHGICSWFYVLWSLLA